MTVNIRPFKREDLLNIQAHDRYLPAAQEAFEALEEHDGFYEIAWTAEEGGYILACCGINRGCAWAFVYPHMSARQITRVTCRVRQVLKAHSITYGPVIATVDADFDHAVRWVKVLGFKKVEASNLWVYDAVLS